MAQSKLSDGANGDFFSINWGWAVGVMMGVLVAGGVSGTVTKNRLIFGKRNEDPQTITTQQFTTWQVPI